MNFINRLQGIFFNPRVTLKAISEKPVWVDTIIILLVILTIFSFIVAPYLQKDQLQVLKNDVTRKDRMGEEAYNRQLEFLENPPPRYILVLGIGAPLIAKFIGFFLQPLILLGMGRMFSTDRNYKQTF
nr:YIP1 family protein [Candidatus Aminicenantes bacterium]